MVVASEIIAVEASKVRVLETVVVFPIGLNEVRLLWVRDFLN